MIRRIWLVEELKDELENIGYRIVFNEFDSSTEIIASEIIDRVNKYKQQTDSETSIPVNQYIDSVGIDDLIALLEQLSSKKSSESEDKIVDIKEIIEFKMMSIPGLDILNRPNNIRIKFLSRYLLTATIMQYETFKKLNNWYNI